MQVVDRNTLLTLGVDGRLSYKGNPIASNSFLLLEAPIKLFQELNIERRAVYFIENGKGCLQFSEFSFCSVALLANRGISFFCISPLPVPTRQANVAQDEFLLAA